MTVGLDIALIPAHGGVGASVASTVAYSAGGVAAGILLARALRTGMGEMIPRGRDVAAIWRRVAATLSSSAGSR
jgi:hypothetical protein